MSCYYRRISNTFSSYSISLLRVSTEIPSYSDSYEEAISTAKAFMGEVIPLLFEPKEDEPKLFLTYVTDLGITGYLVVTVLFSIPLFLILVPISLSLKTNKHPLDPALKKAPR